MKKTLLLILFLSSLLIQVLAQTDTKEIAIKKAQEAIRLMDEGMIDESIVLLKEGEKLDPENMIFPYEIAYAHMMKKEYEEAIVLLNKVKTYNPSSSQVYQLSGNSYSYLGKPNQAIKEYEEGMKHFPNAGNLYLERGNIYLHQENYDEAIKNFEQGIEVDPDFASNYFRLAKLFLHSNDKLSGSIYGELFMNMERSSQRSLEMSKLLFDTYKSTITFTSDGSKIEFCDITIDVSQIENKDEPIKLPLCASFGKNFILAIISEKEINLNSLASIRNRFIKSFFEEDHLKYPNVLFEYQKEMADNNIFDAYNHYLFQMGAPDEFEAWLENNEDDYNRFVDWFTTKENFIKVTSSSRYKR